MTRKPHKNSSRETPEKTLHPACPKRKDGTTTSRHLPSHGECGGGFAACGHTARGTVEQAGKIAICTLLSRILGLFRDMLIIAILGIGADIFFMAFRLPNIIRRMTAEGVLGMAHSVNLGQKFPSLVCAEKGVPGNGCQGSDVEQRDPSEADPQKTCLNESCRAEPCRADFGPAESESAQFGSAGFEPGQGWPETFVPERLKPERPEPEWPGPEESPGAKVGAVQKYPEEAGPGKDDRSEADSVGEKLARASVCQSVQDSQEPSRYAPVIHYSLRTAWKYGLITAFVAVMLAMAAPLCMRLVAPGFDAPRLERTVSLFRWCLLYMPLSAGTAILAATLMSCQRAGYAALAPLFLNVGIIVLGSGAFVTGSATFFAAGVVAGGVLQIVWLVHALFRLDGTLRQDHKMPLGDATGERRGLETVFRLGSTVRQAWYSLTAPFAYAQSLLSARVQVFWHDKKNLGQIFGAFVRKLWNVNAPWKRTDFWRFRLEHMGRVGVTVMVGSSGYLFFFMSSVGASFFSKGGVSAMYIGERLIEFPLAFIGASFAMAFMPQFSVLARDKEALRHAFEKNLRLCCFVIFPATAGIVALHEPIVRMLFGHGAMGDEGVILAARIFAIMGCALPALCLSRQYMGVLVALDGAGRLVVKQGNIMRCMAHTVWGGCVAILGTSVLLGPLLGLGAVALGVVLASWGQCMYLWKLARRELSMTGMVLFPGQDRRILGAFLVFVLLLSLVGQWLNGLQNGWAEALLLCGVVVGAAIGWIGGFVLLGNAEAITLWGMVSACYHDLLGKRAN